MLAHVLASPTCENQCMYSWEIARTSERRITCIKLTWSTWATLMDDQRSRLMADRSSQRWPDNARDDDRLRLRCGRSALDRGRSEISMWPDDAVAGRRSQRWPEDGPDGSRTTAVPTVAGRHSRRWPFGDIDVSVRRGVILLDRLESIDRTEKLTFCGKNLLPFHLPWRRR